MEDQFLKQVTEDITKNPFYEQYYIRKYFGNQPVDSYIPIRMMEVLPDKSIALGLKDYELLELVKHRHPEVANLINQVMDIING